MKSEDCWNTRKRFSHSIGKIFDVPVRIRYSVYLTLLISAGYSLIKNIDYSKPWTGLIDEGVSLLYTVAVFASILLHEIGHATVAVMLKRKVHEIIIYPFLGGTVFKQLKNLSPLNNILVVGAGPLTNFAIAGFLSRLRNINFINAIVKVNTLIGSLNLLPFWPLDGGRILESILMLKGWSNTRINSVVLNSSRLSALGMGITAFTNGDYLSMIFTVFLLIVAHVEFHNDKPSEK